MKRALSWMIMLNLKLVAAVHAHGPQICTATAQNVDGTIETKEFAFSAKMTFSDTIGADELTCSTATDGTATCLLRIPAGPAHGFLSYQSQQAGVQFTVEPDARYSIACRASRKRSPSRSWRCQTNFESFDVVAGESTSISLEGSNHLDCTSTESGLSCRSFGANPISFVLGNGAGPVWGGLPEVGFFECKEVTKSRS